MPQPNKFEYSILTTALNAQRFHIDMTGGWYVWYSHESFLQNFIARELASDYRLNVDLSRKRLRNAVRPRGRPPNPESLRQRFDLIVWSKTTAKVKAVIEIKIGWSKAPVLRDVIKVQDFRKTAHGRDAAGYVLYYTDKIRSKKGNEWDRNTLADRFVRIHDSMRANLRVQFGIRHEPSDFVSTHEFDDPWGFALFRC
ncbi:MAG: hypothetical protein OXO49_03120 [Gammaproteobacteria bacterium]|nr:hypothetical protein [Gammaproteobacteria bacterium]MDE0251970.1 hypothetical protein [Gammaproteobacteria bacterium]MDE0402922.1 hypothetical protein [Gammaproteobacteria bacterium]